MVASVNPSATVTTRSNAFIFANVRLPLTRSSTTRALYANNPTTSTRTRPAQLSKNMRHHPGPRARHGLYTRLEEVLGSEHAMALMDHLSTPSSCPDTGVSVGHDGQPDHHRLSLAFAATKLT
jgi:hypothetical protein